jgi:cytidine deaminase
MNESIQLAYEAAKKAQSNSYSPYSKFPVGAALKFKGHDKLYTGCNVENLSFGGTICAERSAMVAAISELGQVELEYAVVIANTQKATPPCGICRQFLSEFTQDDFPVYLSNASGILKEISFKELLHQR